MTKIISITQNKGGVGKTSSTINLGYLFSKEGKTLLIDLDSQANLSQTFNLSLKDDELSLKDFIDRPDSSIIKTVNTNLDILPNTLSFEAWKRNSYTKRHVSYLLKKAIDTIKADYDYILIDCPPSMDISFDLALHSSNYAIIMMDGHPYCLQGIENILLEINRIISDDITGNLDLKILGLLFNQYKYTVLINQIIEDARENYPVFNTVIREDISIPESQTNNMSTIEYAPKSRAAIDYLSVFNEVKEKINV